MKTVVAAASATWQADGDVTECNGCARAFSFTIRKHHCRYAPYSSLHVAPTGSRQPTARHRAQVMCVICCCYLCRMCGQIFCNSCSVNSAMRSSGRTPQRMCATCSKLLQAMHDGQFNPTDASSIAGSSVSETFLCLIFAHGNGTRAVLRRQRRN